MMTPNAAAGIRDAMIRGAAKLEVPMTPSLLSLIQCNDETPCKQGRCPICTSKEAERLRNIQQSPALSEQQWSRRAYALLSHVRAADDFEPIRIDTIAAAINKTLDQYVTAFNSQDDREVLNYGCLAQIGLVENMSATERGEKVVVVEFVLTGGDVMVDYDVMTEGLHYNFGVDVCDPLQRPLKVEPIPLTSTNGYGVLPDQELLFGYTKRRLDVPERPRVITNEVKLAKMALNYGEHSLSDRTFYRGLSALENAIVFDQHFLSNLQAIDITRFSAKLFWRGSGL